MKHRRAALIAYLVPLACGGNTSSGATPSNDAGPDLPGSGASGGAGGSNDAAPEGGADGQLPECGAQAGQWGSVCTPGEACKLTLPCQSGVQTISMTCGQGNQWAPDATCEYQADTCPGTDLLCEDGKWSLAYLNSCNDKHPGYAASCYSGEQGSSTCGYRCLEGSDWTVGTCDPTAHVLLFDGVCAGDCSGDVKALLNFAHDNAACFSEADCQAVPMPCIETFAQSCGSVALNKAADLQKWQALVNKLKGCELALPAGCGSCAPPSPSCVNHLCWLL